MPKPRTPSAQFVKASDILPLLPVCDSTLRNWVKSGRFPAPISLASPRNRWWRRSVVDRWLQDNGLPPLPPHDADGAKA